MLKNLLKRFDKKLKKVEKLSIKNENDLVGLWELVERSATLLKKAKKFQMKIYHDDRRFFKGLSGSGVKRGKARADAISFSHKKKRKRKRKKAYSKSDVKENKQELEADSRRKREYWREIENSQRENFEGKFGFSDIPDDESLSKSIPLIFEKAKILLDVKNQEKKMKEKKYCAVEKITLKIVKKKKKKSEKSKKIEKITFFRKRDLSQFKLLQVFVYR